MKKKKYNPFKMLGSYIGGTILGTIGYLILPRCTPCNSEIIACAMCGYSPVIYPVFIGGGLVLGFLLGWAIHSLIRKYTKWRI